MLSAQIFRCQSESSAQAVSFITSSCQNSACLIDLWIKYLENKLPLTSGISQIAVLYFDTPYFCKQFLAINKRGEKSTLHTMVLSQVPEHGDCSLQVTTPSPSRHKSMEFGKFYQTSYLDMNGNVIKKGSLSSPNLRPPVGFHRPGKSFANNWNAGLCSFLGSRVHAYCYIIRIKKSVHTPPIHKKNHRHLCASEVHQTASVFLSLLLLFKYEIDESIPIAFGCTYLRAKKPVT